MSLSSEKPSTTIRALEVTDLDTLVSIEQQAHIYPWKKSIHLSCIEQGYPSLILESGDELVAYAVFNYLYDECHLMNITTRPERQGKGYASQLIKQLYQNATAAGMQNVLLEVRESNVPAIAFYRKEGFQEIARRPNYYPKDQGRESAIVMQKALT